MNRSSPDNCTIVHVDLEDGDVWINSKFGKEQSFLCDYSLSYLRITYPFDGMPETDQFVIPVGDKYYIRTLFKGLTTTTLRTPPGGRSNLLIDIGKGELWQYQFDPKENEVSGINSNYQRYFDDWISIFGSANKNISASKGLFHPNAYSAFALSNDTVSIIRWTGGSVNYPTKRFPASSDWNSITFFQDGWIDREKQYYPIIGAIMSRDGFNPALLTYEEGYIPLPGWRNESIRANAGNQRVYWIEDAPSSSIRSKRAFDVDVEVKNETSLINK